MPKKTKEEKIDEAVDDVVATKLASMDAEELLKEVETEYRESPVQVGRPPRYGYPDPEPCDPTPVEMPLGYIQPTPLQDLIANMVRQAVSMEQDEEFETMEEADDFELEDEEDMLLDMSPYTLKPVHEESAITELPGGEEISDPPPDPPSDPVTDDPSETDPDPAEGVG